MDQKRRDGYRLMESSTDRERDVPDETVRDLLVKDIGVALVVLELVGESPDVPDELQHLVQVALKRLLAAGDRLKTFQKDDQLTD